MNKIDLSIIIPSYDEEESLPILIKSIYEKLNHNDIIFEIIIIDDGSTDKTWYEIEILSNKYSNIFPIKFIMHRYIPLIAKWNGYNNIGEKEVNHNKRKFGKTKFGMERYIRGFLDLLSVSFVYRFRKRPMHFFGTFGVLFFIIGFASVGWIVFEKISKISENVPLNLIRPVTDQPLFYIALVSIIIGVQLFLVGFLSELVIQINSDRKGYKIEKTSHVKKS